MTLTAFTFPGSFFCCFTDGVLKGVLFHSVKFTLSTLLEFLLNIEKCLQNAPFHPFLRKKTTHFARPRERLFNKFSLGFSTSQQLLATIKPMAVHSNKISNSK